MSAKVSGKAWELRLSPMDKFVLLALADHADHEGKNVRPGNELLCAKTGLSEKTIGVKIERLTKMGLIELVAGGTGRGQRRELVIDIDAGERCEYFNERDKRKAERDKEKVEAASTFLVTRKTAPPNAPNPQKVEPEDAKGRTSEQERSNLTDTKVELDANLHDKERARLNRHESSIEPSIESFPSQASPSKAGESDSKTKKNLPTKTGQPAEKTNEKNDPIFLAFCAAYQDKTGAFYSYQKHDFVQLAFMRQKAAEAKPVFNLTEAAIKKALGNYFSSDAVGKPTLADFSVNFGVFYAGKLDRYNRWENGNGRDKRNNSKRNDSGSRGPAKVDGSHTGQDWRGGTEL